MGARDRDLVATWLADAARDLTRLVLPVACAGCERADVRLCQACRDALDDVRRCEQDAPRLDHCDGTVLPVWAAGPYRGPVRGVVVSWKDRGRADLTPAVVGAVRRAAAAAAPAVVAAAGRRRVEVVPVPSRAGARRRRGADLTRQLAAGVAAELTLAGARARVAPVLRLRGGRDQVGLGARARGAGAAGRVLLAPGVSVRGRLHVLVDDVVTTGATLARCEDTLVLAGGLVLGAVAVAATAPPNLTRAALLPAPEAD